MQVDSFWHDRIGCFYDRSHFGYFHADVVYNVLLTVGFDHDEGVRESHCHAIVVCQTEKIVFVDRSPQLFKFRIAELELVFCDHPAAVICNHVVCVEFNRAIRIVSFISAPTAGLDAEVDIDGAALEFPGAFDIHNEKEIRWNGAWIALGTSNKEHTKGQ